MISQPLGRQLTKRAGGNIGGHVLLRWGVWCEASIIDRLSPFPTPLALPWLLLCDSRLNISVRGYREWDRGLITSYKARVLSCVLLHILLQRSLRCDKLGLQCDLNDTRYDWHVAWTVSGVTCIDKCDANNPNLTVIEGVAAAVMSGHVVLWRRVPGVLIHFLCTVMHTLIPVSIAALAKTCDYHFTHQDVWSPSLVSKHCD